MLRGYLGFGGACVALLAALAIALQKSGTVDVLALIQPRPSIDETYQRGFRSEVMAKINHLRLGASIEGVRGDEDLQAFLADFVATHENPGEIDLREVFDVVQKRFPGAQYLAANLVVSRDREDLIGRIAAWPESVNSEFESVNTAVFADGGKLGVLGVMARRIPEFSLAAANSGGGKFHNRCPHCGEVHALEIELEARTLIVSCPYCDKPFDIFANDTAGRIRRACEFFDEFSLPTFPAVGSASETETVVSIWAEIANRCEYELDNEISADREVWKSSRETWADRAGDCEDTAILLADALISAGIDARVAIGWNGNIGQHAWVVVRADGEQFLLESTLQEEITAENLAPLAEAADFYHPEQLFDRTRLYYADTTTTGFGADCFSPEKWQGLPFGAPEVASKPRLSLR